jgi:hypothetical protein
MRDFLDQGPLVSIVIEKAVNQTGMHRLVATKPADRFLSSCYFSDIYLQEMEEKHGWIPIQHADPKLVEYRREVN